MGLNDLDWGYCRHCHKEVETESGRLIRHQESYQGPVCRGWGQMPSMPGGGPWKPRSRPSPPVPDPVARQVPRAAMRSWRTYLRDRVRRGE